MNAIKLLHRKFLDKVPLTDFRNEFMDIICNDFIADGGNNKS